MGATPPVGRPSDGVRGQCVFSHALPPASWGRSRVIDPSGKGVRAMLKPATLATRGHSLSERPPSLTRSGRRSPAWVATRFWT